MATMFQQTDEAACIKATAAQPRLPWQSGPLRCWLAHRRHQQRRRDSSVHEGRGCLVVQFPPSSVTQGTPPPSFRPLVTPKQSQQHICSRSAALSTVRASSVCDRQDAQTYSFVAGSDCNLSKNHLLAQRGVAGGACLQRLCERRDARLQVVQQLVRLRRRRSVCLKRRDRLPAQQFQSKLDLTGSCNASSRHAVFCASNLLIGSSCFWEEWLNASTSCSLPPGALAETEVVAHAH